MERFFRSHFKGTSGVVSYGNYTKNQRNPTGLPTGLYFISRSLEEDAPYTPTLVSIYRGESLEWEDLANVAPLANRKRARIAAESNFISIQCRVFGFVLLSVLLASAVANLLCIACFAGQNESVSHVYLVILGSATSGLSIATQSLDERIQSMRDYLGRACLCSVWLFFVGNAIVTATLVAVLCRAYLISRRRKGLIAADIKAAVPAVGVLLYFILVLSLWTSVDPITWTRLDIRKIPLETFGLCQSNNSRFYFALLVNVCCLVLVVSFFLGTKITRRSLEVEAMMHTTCLMLQAWAFGLPLYLLVRTSSADGNYLVRIIFVWVCSMTGLVCVSSPVSYKLVKRRFFSSAEAPRFRTSNLMPEPDDYYPEESLLGLPFSTRGNTSSKKRSVAQRGGY